MEKPLNYIWRAVPYKYGYSFPDDNFYRNIKDAQRRVEELEDRNIFDFVKLESIRLK